MSRNLWPEFGQPQGVRSPKNIIEELGDGLKERTAGLVRFYSDRASINGDEVTLSFNLYSPRLAYHFPFLRAKFSIKNNYPVILVADKMDEVLANDEEALIETLAKIFNAESTVDTIQKLMSLASDNFASPSPGPPE